MLLGTVGNMKPATLPLPCLSAPQQLPFPELHTHTHTQQYKTRIWRQWTHGNLSVLVETSQLPSRCLDCAFVGFSANPPLRGVFSSPEISEPKHCRVAFQLRGQDIPGCVPGEACLAPHLTQMGCVFTHKHTQAHTNKGCCCQQKLLQWGISRSPWTVLEQYGTVSQCLSEKAI